MTVCLVMNVVVDLIAKVAEGLDGVRELAGVL